jgi:hypothetical protein
MIQRTVRMWTTEDYFPIIPIERKPVLFADGQRAG